MKVVTGKINKTRITGNGLADTISRLVPIKNRISELNRSDLKPTELKMVPLTVEIQLMQNICNAKCSFCFGQEENKPKLIADPRMVASFIQEASDAGVSQIDFSAENSEPLLHKDFDIFAKLVESNKMKLGLFTNGIRLNDQKIRLLTGLENGLGNYMVINLSASDAETYKKIYQVDQFNTVVKNVKRLTDEKILKNSDLEVDINYTLQNLNSTEEKINNAINMVQKLNINYFRITFPFPKLYVDDEKGAFNLPKSSIEKIREVVEYSPIKEKILFRDPNDVTGYVPNGYCWAQFMSGCLDPLGNLNICIRTYNSKNGSNGICLGLYSPGNLSQLWNSEIKDLKVDNLCTHCAPGDAWFNKNINEILLTVRKTEK